MPVSDAGVQRDQLLLLPNHQRNSKHANPAPATPYCRLLPWRCSQFLFVPGSRHRRIWRWWYRFVPGVPGRDDEPPLPTHYRLRHASVIPATTGHRYHRYWYRYRRRYRYLDDWSISSTGCTSATAGYHRQQQQHAVDTPCHIAAIASAGRDCYSKVK